MSRASRFVLLAGSLALAGCGGTATGPPAMMAGLQYDPAGMTDDAFKKYDTNGNGAIEGAELDACPGLRRLAGKKGVSRDDLRGRLEKFAAAGPDAVASVSMIVTLNGAPLGGATVTLTPEPFLGPAFKPASCTTDESGYGELKVEGGSGAGVPAGFYKVTVGKKDGAGREAVPAKYNAQSREGLEVFDDGRGSGGPIELRLTTGK